MHERERDEHAPRADPVDEPPLDRRADARARGERARDRARDRERARLLAQVEDDRERVDPDRQPREQRRRDQRRHVGRAQDVGVAPHAPQARSCAWPQHGVHHRRRQLAGERVLLARVKAAEQRPRLAVGDHAVPELRLRPRDRRAAERGAQPQRALPREAAEAEDDVHLSAAARPRARATPRSSRAPPASAGWPAARSAPRRRCTRRAARSPSSRATDSAWLASPTRCSDANRKSPERSPVKIRPVRLPPCAAGASPRIRTRAAGSPKPCIGRPQ